jgi:Family of unknown function (DUF6152)
MKNVRLGTQRLLVAAAIGTMCLVTGSASAHHSYAMYDGSVYRVFTGVMVRVVPNAAHFEMHFVPLNENRDALVRDEKGEPVVWVVQMESAAVAFKHGITRESFPQGTVMSMGVHPRRDGKPAGDRGNSGLFRCPTGKVPAAGKHCDSVEGATAFGDGVLPPDGPVQRTHQE